METSSQLNEFFFIVGTAGMLFMALAVVSFIYLYQRKILKKNLENQSIKTLLQEQEMKNAYAILSGQEQERKRIAGELHDHVGSILTSLHFSIASLQKKIGSEADQGLVEKIHDQVKYAAEENRKLSHELYSGAFKHFGLEASIRQLIESIESSDRIQVKSHLNIAQVSQEIALNIYRILQELFNNTLKYAQAGLVILEINQFEDQLNLIYEDNGKGFDLSQVKTGIGLKNMQTRVEKMQGTLTFDAQPGRGFAAVLDIPLIDDSNPHSG